jgi:predicted DNA-binding antitoxin AbrB/MazE fold protein
MNTQVRAIYENGVFRPLESVHLTENQEVTVTIEENAEQPSDSADQVLFSLPPARWQIFCDALDAAPREIPTLRKLLTEASVFDGDTRSSDQSSSA